MTWLKLAIAFAPIVAIAICAVLVVLVIFYALKAAVSIFNDWMRGRLYWPNKDKQEPK
jgi:hypothetical protein